MPCENIYSTHKTTDASTIVTAKAQAFTLIKKGKQTSVMISVCQRDSLAGVFHSTQFYFEQAVNTNTEQVQF